MRIDEGGVVQRSAKRFEIATTAGFRVQSVTVARRGYIVRTARKRTERSDLFGAGRDAGSAPGLAREFLKTAYALVHTRRFPGAC